MGALEGMQGALEQESKGKAEALRMKKKLESDVGDLEMALEHSNANNLEAQKSIKKHQNQIREAASKLEEEQRQKEHARDALVNAERKAHGMQNGLEEARTLLEQADRNRRMTEQDLSDANEQLSDATVQNQAIAAGKRRPTSQWLMLPSLLMNSEVTKRLPKDSRKVVVWLRPKSRTCTPGWMRAKPTP